MEDFLGALLWAQLLPGLLWGITCVSVRLTGWRMKGTLPPSLANQCRWPTWRQARAGFLAYSMLVNPLLFFLVYWQGVEVLLKAWCLPLALVIQAASIALMLAVESAR